MRLLLPVVLLALCPAAHADPLGELRQLLVALPGTQPVAASVELEYQSLNDDDEDAAPQAAQIALRADDDANGIRLQWSRELMQALAAERRDRDPDAKRPVDRALSQVSVQEIDEYLHAAPTLLSMLDQATLLTDTADKRSGQPARRLTLKLDPPLGKQARKYIKQIDATATIWLDAQGLPIAAEQSIKLSGRAMLVISFANDTRESFEFARRGDRLVVTQHRSDSSSSGGGESGRQIKQARIVVD